GGSLVRGDGARKLVRARTVGPQHEEKRIGLGWIECRPDGSEAGIGNRTRRQAGVPIGIVRMLARKIRAVDYAAVMIAKKRRIDGSGIAIELHADAQPVGENGSNLR